MMFELMMNLNVYNIIGALQEKFIDFFTCLIQKLYKFHTNRYRKDENFFI